MIRLLLLLLQAISLTAGYKYSDLKERKRKTKINAKVQLPALAHFKTK